MDGFVLEFWKNRGYLCSNHYEWTCCPGSVSLSLEGVAYRDLLYKADMMNFHLVEVCVKQSG